MGNESWIKKARNAVKNAFLAMKNSGKRMLAKKEIIEPATNAVETDVPVEEIVPPIVETTEEPVFEPITRKNFYKHPIFWARFLGYALPLSFLLYVLYLNYLPFGYHKTFTIDVGSANDTKVSEFYLEPSKDLSDRKTAPDGTTYRELNGMATAVFKPNAVLKDAEITVETKDTDIKLIPPHIDFDISITKWDYIWNFTKGVPTGLTNEGTFLFDEKNYFDGKSRIEYSSSSNMFEEGPFTVYAEWSPVDPNNNFQEIVGHFNWEILQEKNKIRFMVGRMNNKDGDFYSIEYPIKDVGAFFNKKHNLLATYVPDPKNGHGYIDLYVDSDFAGRTYFGTSTIWKDYNGNKNVTLGKSEHGNAIFFQGYIYQLNIKNAPTDYSSQRLVFHTSSSTEHFEIPMFSAVTTTATNITLYAKQ